MFSAYSIGRPRIFMPVTVLLVMALFILAACSGPGAEPQTPPDEQQAPLTEEGQAGQEGKTDPDESEPAADYEEIRICDLDSALEGQEIRVVGTIVFIDTENPDGTYIDLDANGCQAGVWIDNSVVESLSDLEQELLAFGSRIYADGRLRMYGEEFVLEYIALHDPSDFAVQLNPTERWWIVPQTYHDGEGPDIDYIPVMNITVLHDWSSLLFGFTANPDIYWSDEAIQSRWQAAHDQGMRVEAVLSIIDMFFVDYGPDDDIYSASGIDLNGDHITYEDPVGFVGCTNQHVWQDFTRDKIFQAIDWGADGIIIDDYEGTSRWSSGVPVGVGGLEYGPGACFCPACEEGFRNYLSEIYSEEELAAYGIEDIETFDYSDYLLDQGWTLDELGAESVRMAGWDPDVEILVPLYRDYADFQEQEVVLFLEELKEESIAYAREQYNREIAWSVNAPEIRYGAHRFYELFDRNVGGIMLFGIPPGGTEGYLYRLGYNIHGNLRLREINRLPVVVALMNEYQTSNLWVLKGAEAYANQGAIIEYDTFTIEGASDEEGDSSLHNDAVLKNLYNTFYLEHADLFDTNTVSTMANTAVLYSSASVHYDMYWHTTSFNGLSEILTDLHVQFDPLFIGDGLISSDNLNADLLEGYDIVFLPNVSALTESQAAALLVYMENGGTVAALGDTGLVDEENQPLDLPELEALKTAAYTAVGEGGFHYIYDSGYQVDGSYFEANNPAGLYYQNFIEYNHPGMDQFYYLIGEEPPPRISEKTAAGIREEILAALEQSGYSRIIPGAFDENIAVHLYTRAEPEPGIILHLLNYTYELETDTFFEQENIPVEMALPDGFEVNAVTLYSPDREDAENLVFESIDGKVTFEVPGLLMWDVILLE